MGERERFTLLYRGQHARVHAYAVSRVGHQLAEEVVAETFLVAWRRIDAVPRDHPLPWLLATARNVVRERYRDEMRQRALAEELHRGRGRGADLRPPERSAAVPTGQQVLLTAAEHSVARAGTTTGRYWHRSAQHGSLVHVSAGGESFDMVSGAHFEYYDARDGSVSYDVFQELAAKPATDRDAEALQRAGGKPGGVRTEDGERRVVERDTTPYPFGQNTLTFDRVAALSTDAAQLRPTIQDLADGQATSFVEAAFVLTLLPVTPEVRAAVYRLLAEQPGVRSLGRITDRQGRSVDAIAWDQKYWFETPGETPPVTKPGTGNGTLEERALIDPETGATVGLESYVKTLPADPADGLRVGRLMTYSVELGSGYTNDGPAT